jgi:putative transposase
MKKSRFTTEQIIGFIKQADAGMAVAELGRQDRRVGFMPKLSPLFLIADQRDKG